MRPPLGIEAWLEALVKVLVGLPSRKIDSVQEALAMLNEWAPPKPDGAAAVALEACKVAIAGEIDAETARGLFVAFARRNDLLAPDVSCSIKPGGVED